MRTKNASARAAQLADELNAVNDHLVELVRGLSDAEWRANGANAPGWKLESDEDEHRSIGQIALHTANHHLIQAGIVRSVALGDPPAPAAESSPRANAREADENPHPDRVEVLRRLTDNGAIAAAVLRSLSDEQLACRISFRGWTMSADQLAVQAQIGHVRWHTLSIEEALRHLR